MALRERPPTRKPPAGGSRDSLDAYFLLVNNNPVEAFKANRSEHLASRRCEVRGCDELLPCPDHGVPAEDRGEWLWARS